MRKKFETHGLNFSGMSPDNNLPEIIEIKANRVGQFFPKVSAGDKVSRGQTLVKIPRAIGKSRDITGGLPRVTELFEARKPVDPAVVSEIDGLVKFGDTKRGVRKIHVEGVDGDDRLVVVVEGVVVARNIVANPLQAGGIQPGERDGKAVPHFLLELGHHALEGEHENALAPAPADQLRHQDAGFQGFTQAYRVCNQDALAVLFQRLQGRFQLVGHQVHGRFVAQVNAVIRGHNLAQLGFNKQAAFFKTGTLVLFEPGFRRVQHADGTGLFLQTGEKTGALAVYQFRKAIHREDVAAIITRVRPADNPFTVPDNNPRSRGIQSLHTDLSYYRDT